MLEQSEEYQLMLQREMELETAAQEEEERKHKEENEKWIQRERLAQEDWGKKKEAREKASAARIQQEVLDSRLTFIYFLILI